MRNLVESIYPGGVAPDYGSAGMLGMVRDLARGAAGDGRGMSARGLPPPGRTTVFLLVDGLGDNFLQQYGQGTSLLALRRGRMATVFPSTTAAAVTSVMTGLAPAAHGLTGWFVRDERFGGVIAPLPLVVRADGPISALRLLPRLFPYRTLFQRIPAHCQALAPIELSESRFNRRHTRGARRRAYTDLPALAESIIRSVRSHCPPAYLYAYYGGFDAICHEYGCRSAEALEALQAVDRTVARIVDGVAGQGATLVVSADHGFVDADPAQAFHLDDVPALQARLAAPLSGERRMAFAHLQPGSVAAFADGIERCSEGQVRVVPARELIRAGLFGPGPVHPRLRERIGDLVLVPQGLGTVLDRVPGERTHRMIGLHGGLHADEMWVPVLAYGD